MIDAQLVEQPYHCDKSPDGKHRLDFSSLTLDHQPSPDNQAGLDGNCLYCGAPGMIALVRPLINALKSFLTD